MMFAVMLLLANAASAWDFVWDNLCYNYKGMSTTEVVVIGCLKTGDVVIPSVATNPSNNKQFNVVGIGTAAFKQISITSVVIPNTVTSIGESAFNGCSSLSSITIGSGVKDIGRQAFWNCSNLSSVNILSIEAWCNIIFEDIYANPISLAHHLYLDNTEIKNLVIPKGVATINNYAFWECSGLTSLTIGEGVSSIGERSFSYCYGLTSVSIGDDVKTIGEGAFSGCSNMTVITIGNGLSVIGFQAFESCENLTSVNISSIEAWCNIVFDDLSNPLQYAHHLFVDGVEIKNLVIPNSVKSIGNHAFRECNLNSVKIGENVKTIGDWAFAHCHELTNLDISEALTSIGDYAFFYCEGLTSINIPNSVTTIGESAFGCCKELTSLSLGSGISSTGVLAFTECVSLTSITIPDHVTTIDYGSFRGCCGLHSVSIPNSVTTICDYAFQDCSSLASIIIPNSVTTIGDDGTFWGCSSLISITLPNSLVSIGNRTFYECTNLSSVLIPNSVTSIGDVFWGCNNLTSVTVEYEKPIGINAYTFPNRANATLYVPYGCKNAYEATDYWKEFKKIVELEPEYSEKCAIPTIAYDKGELVFACETEGVKYVSEVKAADAKGYETERVTLTPIYVITVYATKEEFGDSDVATATIRWRNGRPVFEGFSSVTLEAAEDAGDVNGDGEIGIGDIVAITNIMAGKEKAHQR